MISLSQAIPHCYITGVTNQTNYQTAQQLARLIKGRDALAIEARMTEIDSFTVGEPWMPCKVSCPSNKATGQFALSPMIVICIDGCNRANIISSLS